MSLPESERRALPQGLAKEQAGPLLKNAENAGAGMVMIGLALVAWSMYRYWHVNRDIRRGVFRPLDRALMSVTLLLLLSGGFTAAWLFPQN